MSKASSSVLSRWLTILLVSPLCSSNQRIKVIFSTLLINYVPKEPATILTSTGDSMWRPVVGQSSVLDAVSGIRFPQKDNLCTRFATEVILRRGPKKSAKVSLFQVRIESTKKKSSYSRSRAWRLTWVNLRRW